MKRVLECDTNIMDTYFGYLPVEVTCHIFSYVADRKKPQDYQNFLRYLLPLFGINAPSTTYDHTQSTLLNGAQNTLRLVCEILYSSCVRVRLHRIDMALVEPPKGDNTTMPYVVLQEVQKKMNEPYVEIFAFVDSHLCERCLRVIANDEYVRNALFLCAKCDAYMSFRLDPKSDPTIDFAAIKRKPRRAYRWISEAKLRRFCGIPKPNPIAESIRRRVDYSSQKRPTLYLLSDILSLIKDRYISHK